MTITLGVLVSGRGTNLQAIIEAIERGEVRARIALVVSNHPGVLALERAERHELKTAVIERNDYPSRGEHQLAIAQALKGQGVELVVLAGWDRILLPQFVRCFPNRIINIHPSLLPSFAGGLHAQQEALEYGAKVTGCTVHIVTEEVDLGPIVLQAAVPVLEDDTEETIAARILRYEHRMLPLAIELFARGAIQVEGRRVHIAQPLKWVLEKGDGGGLYPVSRGDPPLGPGARRGEGSKSR